MLPNPARVAVWIILYLLFILAPLFVLPAGPLPPARDFWTELSVALGWGDGVGGVSVPILRGSLGNEWSRRPVPSGHNAANRVPASEAVKQEIARVPQYLIPGLWVRHHPCHRN